VTNTAYLRLIVLRLTGILTQGFLLVAATSLYVVGLLEVHLGLLLLALVLTWAILRPAAARALAEHQWDTTAKMPVERDAFIRLRNVRARRRARKSAGIRPDRFDTTQAVMTTLVWFVFLSYLASVAPV
jgi:hypothetical protein